MVDLQPVKGTRDFYPPQLRLRNWLFNSWRKSAQQAGFEEYDACVLEHEALYIRKAGDEISQQLYNFEDNSARRLSLRREEARPRRCLPHRLPGAAPLGRDGLAQVFHGGSVPRKE